MVKEALLFFLDVGLSNARDGVPRGRILSCRSDGSALRTVVEGIGTLPDGLAIDPQHGHIYYTNMGKCVMQFFLQVCFPLFARPPHSRTHGADLLPNC